MTNLRRHGRAERKRSRGQALAEFALVIPIMLLLLAGMIDFGMGLYSYMTIINAARDGARVGSVTCGATTPACSGIISTRVTNATTGLTLTSATPACTTPGGAATSCDSGAAKGGGSVTVTVRYTYRMIWPLAFGTTIPMTTSAKFMVQ